MKKTFTGTIASLAVITALAAPAYAQQQQPLPSPQSTQEQPEEQSPTTHPRDHQAPKIDMSTRAEQGAEANTVTGELVKVDTDQMELTIKAADDTEHTFRYADSTKVVGAEEQVSGLATKAGQLVTVHFTQGAGDTRIATKVHFDKK